MSKSNAKQELQQMLKYTGANIKCAIIHKSSYWDDEDKDLEFKLPVNYTDAELVNYYESLNFEYDSGYGGQELFGTVWLDDNTWLSRGEYDGSEWWEHNVLPEIPIELLGEDLDNVLDEEFHLGV